MYGLWPASLPVHGILYWSELPCPPPGNLPDSVIDSVSLMTPALADRFFTARASWETQIGVMLSVLNYKNPLPLPAIRLGLIQRKIAQKDSQDQSEAFSFLQNFNCNFMR